MTISASTLRNIIAILRNIDRDQIEAEIGRMPDAGWESFRDDPYRHYLRMTDHGQAGVARIVSERMEVPVSQLWVTDSFDRTKAEQAFTDYFVRNYPGPDTIIFDPKWHAPKIFSAAVHAVRSAINTEHDLAPEAVGDPSAWLFHSRSSPDFHGEPPALQSALQVKGCEL